MGLVKLAVQSVLSGALLTLSAAAGAAPSFDCSKAKTQIEQTICGDEQLSKLDAQLAEVYAQKRQSLEAHAAQDLVTAQRDWLAQRKNECVGLGSQALAKCLAQSYQDRISTIKSNLKDDLARLVEDRTALAVAENRFQAHLDSNALEDGDKERFGSAIQTVIRDEKKVFSYVIAYSANEVLCRNVARLYNKQLQRVVEEPEFDSERDAFLRPFTDFENHSADDFSGIGLKEPPEAVNGNYEILPFGEADQRSLHPEIRTMGGRDVSLMTLLKRGESAYSQAAVERGQEQTNFFGDEREVEGLGPIHFLKKWPNFELLRKSAIGPDGKVASVDALYSLPYLPATVPTKVFVRKDGTPIFVSNSAALMSFLDQRIVSVVDVYKLTPTGVDELCYIALAPTKLSESAKVAP